MPDNPLTSGPMFPEPRAPRASIVVYPDAKGVHHSTPCEAAKADLIAAMQEALGRLQMVNPLLADCRKREQSVDRVQELASEYLTLSRQY